MLRRIAVSFTTIVLLCTAFASAADVTVRAVLVDEQLNQKPVPRMIVVAKRMDGIEVSEGKTSLDGVVSFQLAPGHYTLFAADGINFGSARYVWSEQVDVAEAPLSLLWSNDNAQITRSPAPRRVLDDFSDLYKQRESSVVTVWSDLGHGTGFVVDPSGIIVTNDHVVGNPTYLAVQFDTKRKVAAHLLASDSANDIAVIWANLEKVPDIKAAPIAKAVGGEPTVLEGERVFTIGSPLEQRKIITSGIASKVEPHAILSDININPGNSGGPLFNSLGEVVGITTFVEQQHTAGPGVAGIVCMEMAAPVIETARRKMADLQAPSAEFLPVEPTEPFPIEALKAAIKQPRFDERPYRFSAGGYDVVIATPVWSYWHRYAATMEVANKREQRRGKQPVVQNAFQPLDELRTWAFYAGEYRPVIQVFARPKLRETFWSAVGRGMLAGAAGYSGTYAQLPPANLHYVTDFYQMRLFCGDREVPAIHPVRAPEVADFENAAAMAKDATYVGAYTFSADAISPSCGSVILKLYSEKNPAQPDTAVLPAATVSRVWSDFAPFRTALADGAAPQPKAQSK